MDGGRDFEGNAARLGPHGGALLQHAVAELRKPPSPYLWPDEAAIEEDRAELERAVAAGFKLHRPATFLTVTQAKGKQAACDLIPPVRRGKAQKKSPARMERERLVLNLWRIFASHGLSFEDTHANLEDRFNWYRSNIFPGQRDYQAAPPRGDGGYDDLFWRILRQVDAPMVTKKTIRKYLNRSAGNL